MQTKFEKLINAYANAIRAHEGVKYVRMPSPDQQDTANNEIRLTYAALNAYVESLVLTPQPMPPQPNIPFDEAAALAGEPVEAFDDRRDMGWYPVHYVGKAKNNTYVVETDVRLMYALPSVLRMKRKEPVVVYVNINIVDGDYQGHVYDTALAAERASPDGVRAVTAFPVTLTVAK